MPAYQGNTKNLSIEAIRKLKLCSDGVELPNKPLFTPAQCEYIWNETSKFVKNRETSLNDTNLKKDNGYLIPNIRNIFHLGGKPVIGFLVMEAMARWMADFMGTTVDKIICSIDGFYFQESEDVRSDVKIHHMNFHTDAPLHKKPRSGVIQSLVQITPGEKNGSCFTTFLGSNNYVYDTVANSSEYSKEFNPISLSDINRIKDKYGDPVVFDNDDLPPGQMILFYSDMVHSARHSSNSKRLVYYVTCWQREKTEHSIEVNIIPKRRQKTISSAYVNSRLTGHNLCMFDLSPTVHFQKNADEIKKIMKEKMLYYLHPDLDTDLMARLVGFENLEDLRNNRERLITNIVSRHFDNVQTQLKTMAEVRVELYGSYNRLKRKLVFSDEVSEMTPPLKITHQDI